MEGKAGWKHPLSLVLLMKDFLNVIETFFFLFCKYQGLSLGGKEEICMQSL